MADGVYQIPLAQSDVAMRLGLLLLVKGSFRQHTVTLDKFFQCLSLTNAGVALRKQRTAGELAWRDMTGALGRTDFENQFGFHSLNPGPWRLELAEREEGGIAAGAAVEVLDVVSPLGGERCSYLRVVLSDTSPVTELASLANWTVNNVPLWWGSAGWFFQHTAGPRYTAFSKIAALAKRYWGVQVQDLGSLQWVSIDGIPGASWLTLVGREFVESKGSEVEDLSRKVANEGGGIFLRRGEFGLVVAAGSKPLKGDINIAEPLEAYERVTTLMQPLLLAEYPPLPGPFAEADVLKAWLGRFQTPDAWLECDISAD